MSTEPLSASASSGNRRNEASRRAILRAAFELASESGYGSLSIEGIAARARVGKQTIYRWWASKGAVLIDALLMMSESPAGEQELPDTGNLAADLKAVLRATSAELADPGFDRILRALTSEILHDPELAAAYAERLDAPMQEMKKRRLRKAQQQGELPLDLDLDLALDLIWSPLFRRWLLRTGPLSPDFGDRLIDTALKGLGYQPRPRAEP